MSYDSQSPDGNSRQETSSQDQSASPFKLKLGQTQLRKQNTDIMSESEDSSSSNSDEEVDQGVDRKEESDLAATTTTPIIEEKKIDAPVSVDDFVSEGSDAEPEDKDLVATSSEEDQEEE